MQRNVFLILIFLTGLFVLFQNFTVPARVLPTERKFESNELNPKKRVLEFIKFQAGDELTNKIEHLKSKLKFEWGGGNREPQSETAEAQPLEAAKKADPLKYSLQNFKTLRIYDGNSQLNCRVDKKGLDFVFEQKLSSSSSYVIEHNAEEQKSEAKFQFSW